MKLTTAIAAIWPNFPLGDMTMASYVRALRAVPAHRSQAVFDAVVEHCERMPAPAKLLDLAADAAQRQTEAERNAHDHEIENRFRLASGITPEQERANVVRLKALTRDYLHRLNATKAARNGVLPDDWQRTEAAETAVDRTFCSACKGRDPRCPYCEGRGVVCPTCGGAHVLRRAGESGERPLYVGCHDCTDWVRQSEHRWDDHGYPVYERDRFRERDAVHGYRNRMRTERAA